MKENKKIVIAIIAVLVVIIAVILFLVFGKNNSSDNIKVEEEDEMAQIIPTIAPDEIGFSLTAGKAGRTVILEVSKTTGLKAVEYTLSYLDKDDIERGAYGQLELNKTPARKEITLGTCSDVCHYDEGVSSVKIVLKIIKVDNNVYQLEETLEL